MRYQELRESLQGMPYFSLDSLRLREPDFHLIQLIRWQKKGYIKQIMRGQYLFADADLSEELMMQIANKLVAPSYVSLEKAFSLYSLIPEGVFQITSVTSKKTQQLDTEIASFNYRHVKPELMFGYTLLPTKHGNVKLAYLEKAILDFLYLNAQADNQDFFEGMRFDRVLLNEKLDVKKIKHYSQVFNKKKLSQRLEVFLNYVTHR